MNKFSEEEKKAYKNTNNFVDKDKFNLYICSMNGLTKAIEQAGSQAKLAALLGVKQQHVSYWLRSRVPAEWCRPISEATGVPVSDLRPDLFADAA